MLAGITDAALGAASPQCSAAEVRVERIRSQSLRLRDTSVEGTSDDIEYGMGVRVVVDGAVGFAATVDVGPDAAAALTRQAIETARVTARAGGGRVELAPEPSHGEVHWSSQFEIDPITVTLADKVALLTDWSARLLADAGVTHTVATLLNVSEETYLADLGGHPGHPAPGAHPSPDRGAGHLRRRFRDHAQLGPAGRPRLGVPERLGLGLGGRTGRHPRAPGPQGGRPLGGGRDL